MQAALHSNSNPNVYRQPSTISYWLGGTISGSQKFKHSGKVFSLPVLQVPMQFVPTS